MAAKKRPNPDFAIGKSYSMTELGVTLGGAALIEGDRIVTEQSAWERMTVGRLRSWLNEAVRLGAITDDTEVWVDADPEGNDTHPMRAAAEPVSLKKVPGYTKGSTVLALDEDEEVVDLPAPGVWFGVGY